MVFHGPAGSVKKTVGKIHGLQRYCESELDPHEVERNRLLLYVLQSEQRFELLQRADGG
jgi:hypothetical protein